MIALNQLSSSSGNLDLDLPGTLLLLDCICIAHPLQIQCFDLSLVDRSTKLFFENKIDFTTLGGLHYYCIYKEKRREMVFDGETKNLGCCCTLSRMEKQLWQRSSNWWWWSEELPIGLQHCSETLAQACIPLTHWRSLPFEWWMLTAPHQQLFWRSFLRTHCWWLPSGGFSW